MSQRVDQLNALVQQHVAGILEREMEWPKGVLVTVTRALVADDAESAKIFLSVWPYDQGEAMVREVEHKIADIQQVLNRTLVMKFVPKIRFELDESEEKAKSIMQLLDRVAEDPTLTPVPPAQPEEPAA